MIGLINRDSSYFLVKYKDQASVMQDISKKIISFTVTEEIGKMMAGTMSFLDQDFFFTNLFRMGKQIELEWGYQKKAMFYSPDEGKDQAGGSFKRSGVCAIIQSPSGGGTETGVKTYNCSFISRSYQAGVKNNVYGSGTKADVISLVFTGMGIKSSNQYIQFVRGTEIITPDTMVMQYESDFKFLQRLAFEWGAVFEISENAKGEKIGMFSQIGTDSQKKYTQAKGQLIFGSSMSFNYMNRIGFNTSLIKSFTWSQQGGSGDNVQIIMVNGQPQFQRYNAETEQTITYKLDSNKMRAEMGKEPNFTAKSALLKDWLQVDKFDTLVDRKYFIPVMETTAPQGIGMDIKMKTLGNPMLIPPMTAIFEEMSSQGSPKNFPDIFKSGKLKFWIRKVTHTIDTNGYNCDVDIVDGFTLSGGSMVS